MFDIMTVKNFIAKGYLNDLEIIQKEVIYQKSLDFFLAKLMFFAIRAMRNKCENQCVFPLT